tara:strand:+ start:169 stop:483 length:315 start_codon:yes stop_codon:yes gene_type:complete
MKPKLVRDHIPRIIEDTGSACIVSYVNDTKEHNRWLRMKMEEEVVEFIEDPSYEEAADMLEVVKGFCQVNGLSWEDVVEVAQSKAQQRGGFSRGAVLEQVVYDR